MPKEYKGTVIKPFKVRGKKTIQYKLDDVYKTTSEIGYNHLINTKRIKK